MGAFQLILVAIESSLPLLQLITASMFINNFEKS
jgi:hypothetical protein